MAIRNKALVVAAVVDAVGIMRMFDPDIESHILFGPKSLFPVPVRDAGPSAQENTFSSKDSLFVVKWRLSKLLLEKEKEFPDDSWIAVFAIDKVFRSFDTLEHFEHMEIRCSVLQASMNQLLSEIKLKFSPPLEIYDLSPVPVMEFWETPDDRVK